MIKLHDRREHDENECLNYIPAWVRLLEIQKYISLIQRMGAEEDIQNFKMEGGGENFINNQTDLFKRKVDRRTAE